VKSSRLVLSLVLLTPGALAQATLPNEFSSGCSALERKALLQPTDPAYSYAIDLARSLASKGIHVECLCASKLQRWFRGEAGAAYFHTRNGVFDAVFLPKGQVFQVEMIEKHENGRHMYLFRGTPTGAPTIDSSKAMWIVQHENALVLVSDQSLAARLEQALNSH
jgi:hypothetical protein